MLIQITFLIQWKKRSKEPSTFFVIDVYPHPKLKNVQYIAFGRLTGRGQHIKNQEDMKIIHFAQIQNGRQNDR